MYPLTFNDPNSQKLIIETFKVKINLAPKTVNDIFEIIECPYLL